MNLLKRGQIQPPVLPKETVDVPELGGAVVVHGLMLRDRLQLAEESRASNQPQPGETPDQANARVGASTVGRVLSMTVRLADGTPLYTEDQWNQFGAVHYDAAIRLFNAAMRLSGQDKVHEAKNS